MKFLLTGGTGFIGSHMAELLIASGHEVVCPVRDTSSLRHLNGIPVQVIALEGIEQHISGNTRLDYVIHLAAATRARDYDGYRASNVVLTQRLLDLFAGRQAATPIKRFVLVSSQAVAGPSPDCTTQVKESVQPAPVSLYGRSKLEAENEAGAYMDRVPITIVRPPTVFGPRDTDVLGVFRAARFGFAPYLAGPERLVSIIYVKDLVEGILEAAMSETSEGKTYFLANRDPVVWKDFCLHVARVMGKRALAVPVPVSVMAVAALAGDLLSKLTGKVTLFRSEKFDEMKQIAWVCSAEKAFVELGWSGNTPMSEAIRETADWY
jgi:nucleoside-diphosphate-sugar epimerase